jgi:hypothetical protein
MASRSGCEQMVHLREWRSRDEGASAAGSAFICLSFGARCSGDEFSCGFRRKPVPESLGVPS